MLADCESPAPASLSDFATGGQFPELPRVVNATAVFAMSIY
jgi:hypothetical protein